MKYNPLTKTFTKDEESFATKKAKKILEIAKDLEKTDKYLERVYKDVIRYVPDDMENFIDKRKDFRFVGVPSKQDHDMVKEADSIVRNLKYIEMFKPIMDKSIWSKWK
mgnify:CR=1 FL=1